MDTVVSVTHPLKMEQLVNTGRVRIIRHNRCGPLGLIRYTIETDNQMLEEIRKISAFPYSFRLPTDVLEQYSFLDYLAMLKLFLKKTIRAEPDDFEILRYAQPRTTHIYPIYIDIDAAGIGIFGSGDCDYLYVSDDENMLLATNALSMLGYSPISNDPLSVNSERLPLFTDWGGSCIIHSENKTQVILDLADKMLMDIEKVRREETMTEKSKDTM